MKKLSQYLRLRLAELDRLLRGDLTQPEVLADSHLMVSARGLAVVAVLLAMIYGGCMGSFSLLKETPPGLVDPYGPVKQLVASAAKTPALFVLTLLVTLPSLYVFNALVGSQLTLLGLMRLLVAALAVNVSVLASLGTIVLFFSLTTKSYSFVILLNVAAFTAAGVLGLLFLLQTLHRLGEVSKRAAVDAETDDDAILEVAEVESEVASSLTPLEEGAAPVVDEGAATPSALDMPSGQVLAGSTRLVFRCWIVLFSLVGAQMGWVLRPFVGNPELPFTLFRDRESNFFAAVFGALQRLLIGD